METTPATGGPPGGEQTAPGAPASPPEPRSSRREEARSDAGKGSQSLLTSAATVEGRSAPRESGSSLPKGTAIRYFGDYVLLGEIAQGGMGVVYRGRQVSLNRPVAVKMIRPDRLSTPEAIQRFRTEAEAAAALDHPNVIPIYEIGEHQGQPYFSMRLVDGPALAHLIAGRPMPSKRAAQILATVAHAVHHAHQRGVLHRDLKPSNILLEQAESKNPVPIVTDFGLAKMTDRGRDQSASGAVLGTIEYMAPEQAAGRTKQLTTAADIYSLGAILFAMLTGRSPFHRSDEEGDWALLQRVKDAEPPHPRSLAPGCPRDLEIICLKCLEKEPTRRYASALELAEDLENFLDGRPITARPVGIFERVWIWTLRHPAHLGLASAAFLAVSALLVALFLWHKSEESSRENKALLSLRSATFERLTGMPKQMSWRRKADYYLTAAHMLADKPLYRDQVASITEGLDAALLVQGSAPLNRQVIFDLAGERLLLAGTTNTETLLLPSGNSTSSGEYPGKLIASPRGVMLQLVRMPPGQLVVWQPSSGRALCELRLPAGLSLADGDSDVISAAANTENLLALVSRDSKSNNVVVCWRLPSGEVARTLPVDSRVTALAMSAEGSVVAFGDLAGQVRVWELSTGELLERVSLSALPVYSMAFAPSLRKKVSRQGHAPDLLLAVGDQGGSIGIWSLAEHRVQALCRGGHYEVFALAFGPDGTTLASGGRGPVRLWDAGTGAPLLDFAGAKDGSYCDALSFSPDGLRLAASTGQNPEARQVRVWQLHNGRGVATLRGLSSGVTKVAFSPRSDRLAAVGLGWEVAVWDIRQKRLLHVIDSPRGITADNFAVAFNPDGRLLAISTFEEAQLWDLTSGKVVRSWNLSPGLANAISFPKDDKLFLLRVETLHGKEAPLRSTPWQDYPRVCRLRNLLGPEDPELIREITDFNERLLDASASSDGHFFALEGFGSTNGVRFRKILAVDTSTGQTAWQRTSTKTADWARNPFSSRGARLAFTVDGSQYRTINLATGPEDPVQFSYQPALGPELSLCAVFRDSGDGERGVSVFQAGRLRVTLGMDTATALSTPSFDSTGRWLAWGNTDGTVSLCDLEEVRAELHRADLSW